jgi:nicotinic acid mononucleotide adenylyltransferase
LHDTRGVIFPGAFHPLHDGHRKMAHVAADILGKDVEFELSVRNVDKPELNETEVARRVAQFESGQAVWLTRAPTFAEKARIFPEATFIVGTDTLVRIADPHYYGNDPSRREQALEVIATLECRFLVFGRSGPGGFEVLSDLDLPPQLSRLCQEVPAAQFRADVSSSEIRRDPRSK